MPAQILIADDRMTAWLLLEAGEVCPVPLLRDLLSAAGVVHGLQRAALAEAGRPDPQLRRLVIALGDQPQRGADGSIELLVDVHDRPVKDGDGTFDLHHPHRFCDVAAGQALVRALPPTAGRPGRAVDGREIPALAGVPADLGPWAGDGVVRDGEAVLAAGLDGVCACRAVAKGQVLSVTGMLSLHGDVDRMVGDLDSRFSIEVGGDIKAGFGVKSGGSISVRGAIEDARVSALGGIQVGGILAGANRVKARGDLVARHIEERTVKCRSLAVANSLVAVQVFALGHVAARDIVGGRVMCAGSVACDRLGDELGTPTHIHVGVDPYEQALFANATADRDRALFALHDTEERCRNLSAKVQQGALLHRSDVGVFATELKRQLQDRERLTAELARCDQQLALHAERIKATRTLVERARIAVAKSIHAGVTVVFGDAGSYTFREFTKGTVLTCRDGKIMV